MLLLWFSGIVAFQWCFQLFIIMMDEISSIIFCHSLGEVYVQYSSEELANGLFTETISVKPKLNE